MCMSMDANRLHTYMGVPFIQQALDVLAIDDAISHTKVIQNFNRSIGIYHVGPM